MSSIIIEGGVPLIGTIDVSGSKNLAIKLIYASMFSNDDVILENVPRVGSVEEDVQIVKSVGAKAEWAGKNTLILNGSSIETYKIPYKVGERNRTVFLFAAPLLHRFGKAFIPKIKNTSFNPSSIGRFLNVWDSLGIIYYEDENYFMLSSENISPSNISFKTPTQMGTETSILLASFISGETIINNASQEPEIDELISFMEDIGVTVSRIEPTKIRVLGTSLFKGTRFTICPDKVEAVCFIVACLITNGNMLIKNVRREDLTSFVSLLMKIGAKFEFVGNELKVWRAGEELVSSSVTISPFPGFIPDWQPFITLLFTRTTGESVLHDTVYLDRFDYVKDLNRMGAKIDMVKPSEVGLRPVISDDAYDIAKKGEPSTVLKVHGPTKLRANRFDSIDLRFGSVFVLAALGAEGKSEIFNFEKINFNSEKFFEKLQILGAKLHYVTND